MQKFDPGWLIKVGKLQNLVAAAALVIWNWNFNFAGDSDCA